MVASADRKEFRKVPLPPDLNRAIRLTENARTVLQKRYLRKGEDGKPVEDEAEMFWRVAYHVALAEKDLGGDDSQVEYWARRYYDLLTSLRFFPNSPTFTGAGTPLGQLAACFTAGMRVTTDKGIKPISDLVVGDRVLTHQGRFRPVTETHQRAYSGELLRIKIKLIGTTLEVTPEHPILTPTGWVKAGDLRVHDKVAVGIPVGVRTAPQFDLAESVYADELEVQLSDEAIRVRRPSVYQNSGRQATWANRFIEVTSDLARLCGYYVAEGTLGVDERYVRFTFSKDELAYQEDVIHLFEAILGITPGKVESNHGNWINLNIFNRAIVAWFRDHFGTGSNHKRLPIWLQYADKEIQTEFLVGLMRGDGVYHERSYIIPHNKSPFMTRALRLTLANPPLIQQIWQMCLRLGYNVAIRQVDTTYVTENANDTAQIGFPPLTSRELVERAFGISLPEPKPQYVRNYIHRIDDQPYFEIESIEAHMFMGTVYNCEVDEDHSYVTEGVVVHNCFVLAIEDDMGRTGQGIFETLRNAALIQQTGGGNGFSFSRLRPKGAVVKSSNGAATGPVGFLRVYDQAFGEIAQGGCLTPDTLVFTDQGLLRLDEIVTHVEPGWKPHEIHVATDEGMRPSYQGYHHGVAPVLRIKTEDGIELTGTPNHKLKVMTSEGAQWRRLDEIQPGDSLMVVLGEHRGYMQTLVAPKKQHGNQVMPTFPTTLDEEFAFFLGYLMGDGFIATQEDDHRVGVTVAHSSYLMVEMPALLHRLFGDHLNIRTQQKLNDASVTYVIDNHALKTFLQLNGLNKAKSSRVAVPRAIRQSPPNVVAAFLRGLFEADGSVSHSYPQLISTSQQLIREVATLLMGLGCPVHIRFQSASKDRYGTADLWNLRIQSFRGLQAWQENIGCDERSRFQVCMTFEPDLTRETGYALPTPQYWVEPVLEAITLPQIDKLGRGMGRKMRSSVPELRRSLLRYTRGERQLTLSGYTLLSEQYPEFAEHARSVDKLWFTRVTGVEDAGEALTLDLEVEENHTYLSNGMVCHNSRRGANMAVLRVDHPDIREFIQCKSVEGAIENFNISVGITDAFMEAVENDATYDLINPQDGEVWETVRAREIFDLIVQHAYRNGEPGVLFLDAANRENPVPHLYELESTNPCVTGDTLIYTSDGLFRAAELFDTERLVDVTIDGRFGYEPTFAPASRVFRTGVKPIYRLQTREGYYLRATADHRIMTEGGWVELQNLEPDDKIHILNRKGGFGNIGTLEDGRVLGWLVGDGTVNRVRAVLSFFGEEKRELAPVFAGYVDRMVSHLGSRAHTERTYPIGVVEIEDRDEARIASERLLLVAQAYGLTEDKHRVPEAVFKGSEAMQRGFLQALFTADGSFQDGGEKGGSVRLAGNKIELLEGVQQLLLNFGIASRIYRNRRSAGYRNMPDGKGGLKQYWCEAQHELAVSKISLAVFAEEIGFMMLYKQQALKNYISRCKRGLYQERFVATVETIILDGEEEVFDLTEPLTSSFVANGTVIHNCGEQFLGPYENCCLGSINLARHITPDGRVDWDKLQESIELSTRFLDHVVTANAYVPAVPQLREAAERVRRIGLGIMGLGDLMYALGVRYGSLEGQECASQIMEFVRYHCMKTSIQLAREKGAFPAIEGSRYDPDDLKWTIPQPLVEHVTDWGRPEVDWLEVEADLKQYGIRNGAQLTCAPTGTISTVSGCEGYGCEPVFALAYVRYVVNTAGNSDDRQALQYTSPLFEQALRRANLPQETIDRIITEVNETGTCQHIMEVPDEIRRVFVVAGDITAEEHIRMQAAMQVWTDNAISKTINAPSEATQADVAKAYMLGWRLGCKGLTVYVTGSREKVVLETRATKDKKEGKAEPPAPVNVEQPTLFNEDKKPRPRRLKGYTYRVETPAGTTYIVINENGYGEGQPFEVFIQTAKAGSEVMAVSEAMGRLISYILRIASPVSPRKRLREVIRQLAGIGGERTMGFGPNRVRSLPDGMSQIFHQYMEETEELAQENPSHTPSAKTHQPELPLLEAQPPKKQPLGDICPSCGSATLVNEEGCKKCYSCGYSQC